MKFSSTLDCLLCLLSPNSSGIINSQQFQEEMHKIYLAVLLILPPPFLSFPSPHHLAAQPCCAKA